MSNRAEWKILLDSPADRPELGFSATASALASVILNTPPKFSVGIFGGWGSGKTTLMKAISSHLDPIPGVISVDFNAWRFEREPLLLVPLLDSIRSALLAWSTQHGDNQGKARTAAVRIGRVVRALASGLSAEVQIPGIASVSYDVGKGISELGLSGDAEGPKSLYVAAFDELKRAFDDFKAGGVGRVVIFVDDLDRCLPSHALDVLESMKLFFDIHGFIFVVGLDEHVVERAVVSRFSPPGEPAMASTTGTAGQAGEPFTALSTEFLSREYVKKIFQVPYSLPPIAPAMLESLLKSIRAEQLLGAQQWDDLRDNVQPYLKQIAVDGKLNPREVKRFINTYTLQTTIRPELRPNVVLALQAMFFRYEWQSIYNLLLTSPGLFIGALKDYRGEFGAQPNDVAFSNVDPKAWLPPDLAVYLQSPLVLPLIDAERDLPLYLSSLAETTSGTTNSWLVRISLGVGELRRKMGLVHARQRVTEADLTMLEPAFKEVSQGLSEGEAQARPLHRPWETYQENLRNLREALALPDTVPEDVLRLIQAVADDINYLFDQVQILWAGRR